MGLNFDFVVLNWTKQLAYLIYNVTLFFSPVVQRQYHEKYGYGTVSPSQFFSPFLFLQMLSDFDYSCGVGGCDYDVGMLLKLEVHSTQCLLAT